MLVSIIIPAYNEEKYIGRTLESIKQLNIPAGCELETVVVDGSSTDKTAVTARSRGAKVIPEPHKSIGFTRQEGLKHASGEIVAFTDADTIVPVDWLQEHIQALTTGKAVCSFGTYRVTDGRFPYFQITNYLQPFMVAANYRLFKTPLAGGQNIACRKKEAIDIGGFDDSLELLEDADFVKRMGKVGKVAFLPDCIVYSSGRRSKEGIKYFLRAGVADFEFFVLGKRKFKRFPDFR